MLADTLRTMRLDSGLTLEALSERAGVSVRGISDIERGVTTMPRVSTITALAVGLELSDADRRRLVSEAREARSTGAPSSAAPRPPRVSDFIGRENELAELIGMLDRPDAIVAITGPGGFGKTSLALEAVARTSGLESAPFVDLAGQGRPPLTPLEVLQAVLRHADDELADPPTVLEEAIARWRSVAPRSSAPVLLDNVTREDQVRPLLSIESRRPILMTSRRTIGGITTTGRLALDSLEVEGGAELLRRIIPEGQQRSGGVEELAELCHGVPLALRIAGNRVASRPATVVADFVERMRSEERRLSALVAGDLSVDAVLSLSFDELSPATADLFCSLSVIDGVTFDASIAAAAAGVTADEAERGLEELVDLGMLESRQGGRYRLHDLLRVYAASKLAASGSADDLLAIRDRLTTWLLSTMIEIIGGRPDADALIRLRREPSSPGDVGGFDRPRARSWILSEADHWWPAVQRAAQTGEHVEVLRLVIAIGSRYALWPAWGRWYDVNELGLRSAEALGDQLNTALQHGVLAELAMVERGDPGLARHHAESAARAAEAADDVYAIARSRFLLGWIGGYTGQLDSVADDLAEAIDGYTRAGAMPESRQARAVLGLLQRLIGRTDQAIADLKAVRADLPEEVDPEEVAFADSFARSITLEELANSYVAAGDPVAALEIAEELLVYTRALDEDLTVARAHVIRARALLGAGRAAECLDELAIVDLLLEPFAGSGHTMMIRMETDALERSARSGADGAVPGAVADLAAHPHLDDDVSPTA